MPRGMFIYAVTLTASLFAIDVPVQGANGGEGVYFGVYGGMAFPETFDDVKGRKDLAGASFSDLKLNSGPMVGLKIGVNGPVSDSVGRFLGIELDGSYVSSQIKAQNVRLSGPGGSVNLPLDASNIYFVTGALHLLLRYPGQVFQPYIGAGPGVVYARASDLTISGLTVRESGSATSFALSGVAGFRLQVSDHVGLFFEYKHIRTALEFETIEGNAVVHAGVGGIAFLFQ